MEVRAKKALGQHFLTDLSIAQRIADALVVPEGTIMPALEVGPGMGVLTQYLLQRPEVDLRMVEIDTESVNYLLLHFPQVNGKLLEADFLRLKLEKFFTSEFCVIGNFPYNISSQIFFKILDYKEQVPQVVCMIQKEVAERIAEKPGTKTYGILSVLLQAWYDIEYLFTVGEGAFNPPPKVQSTSRTVLQPHAPSLLSLYAALAYATMTDEVNSGLESSLRLYSIICLCSPSKPVLPLLITNPPWGIPL